MANIKSQIKRNRQNERRRQRNKAARSEVATRTKSAMAAAEAGDDDVDAKVRDAVSAIDKAASAGVFHRNTAARKKARLTRRVATAQG